MCSSPNWQVGSSWFRKKFSPANRNKGYRGEQISRKLSPANWMQGVTAISRKISRSWAPRLQNSQNRWAKKWGPTCDRDISNSAIYTTAIYRAYTVLSWEWGCNWSSANRRCSNYIWVINYLMAHKGASYIRDVTVCIYIYGLTL